MADHQIQELVAQVQANIAKIDAESGARAIADKALASRVAASEAAIAAMNLQSIAEAGNAAGEKILLERRLIEIERRLGIA